MTSCYVSRFINIRILSGKILLMKKNMYIFVCFKLFRMGCNDIIGHS